MNKYFSRLILWLTALSAVFFTSSVFAYDVKYAADLTPYYENAGTVNRPDWSRLIARLPWTYKVNRFESYGWWRTVRFGNSSTYNYPNAPYVYFCKNQASGYENVSTATYDGFQEVTSFNGWAVISVIDYGNYLFVDGTGYDAYIARHNCAFSSTLAGLGTLPPAPTPPVTPCTTDTIASGGNCSCKKTGTYSASSGSTPIDWKYDGLSVWSFLTASSVNDLFSGKFRYSYMVYPSWSSYKPDITLATLDAWDIGGTRSIQAIGSSTGMIYTDSRTLVSNASWNSYLFYTSDGGLFSKTPIVGNISTNSSSNDDNTFNSFVINSSTGNIFLLLTNRFQVYYQRWSGWDYSNVADNYTYLGVYSSNTMITLPYGEKTRRVKIVPLATTVYVSWVSPFNTPFAEDKICTVLSGTGLTNEVAFRSSFSWSLYLTNTNFCGSALDVPYIGSALGAMCNFVQPLIKPLVWGFQTTVDMINIVPPSTAPTTFDYYPSFTFSWMTMHISTQTGAIPVYSSWSDVNPLKITSDEASSNMKIWVLALISILLYLVVYALHFWIVAGLVWLLLHISRFFTGFLWKHSGTGNIWSLAPFLVYAWVFFTALLSIIASVSFLLPLLQVIRAYALFLITWLTSFAPWSYALFSGFYIVVFSSIFLVGTFYLIYVLFEKHSRLN